MAGVVALAGAWVSGAAHAASSEVSADAAEDAERAAPVDEGADVVDEAAVVLVDHVAVLVDPAGVGGVVSVIVVSFASSLTVPPESCCALCVGYERTMSGPSPNEHRFPIYIRSLIRHYGERWSREA